MTKSRGEQLADVNGVRLFDYDAELRLHNVRFRAATGIGRGDRVLDIGCGAGQTTRDAARRATAGSVLGVDLNPQLLHVARQRTELAGLHNVDYQQADAQTHRFPAAHFDVCISRFGVMFFADPAAAFSNIRQALRDTARVVFLVWQGPDRNEWCSEIHRALTSGTTDCPAATAAGQGAFSLADPAATTALLTAAGFTQLAFDEVHEPVYYGPDPASAYDTVLSLRMNSDLLAGLSATAAAQARQRLRATIAAHDTGDGIFFDSRAWLVTGRCR